MEERKGMYPEVTYVYVSPMKRCVQTAEIIYPEMMKAGAYSCNEKLRECDFGLFENHNYIELSGCPEYQAWIDSGGKLPFPEGESREAFIRRTLEGFREVVRDAQAHDRETIAVVAHGGTIMSIMDRYARDENGQPDAASMFPCRSSRVIWCSSFSTYCPSRPSCAAVATPPLMPPSLLT